MKILSKELIKLRILAEKSLKKNDELNKILVQLEATLALTEARKVADKNKWY